MSSTGTPATGGGALPPPLSPGRAGGNGKLTSAGVLQIIQGALAAILGLWLFTVTQSDLGGAVDDLSGNSVTFAAAICLGFAAALIWTAVLCIKGHKGGWVTVIVFQSIFLLGGLSNLSNPDGMGNAFVTIAYCGAALFLAISGGKESQRCMHDDDA